MTIQDQNGKQDIGAVGLGDRNIYFAPTMIEKTVYYFEEVKYAI